MKIYKSCVLALPLALALVVPAAAQSDSQNTPPSNTTTTTTGQATTTTEATVAKEPLQIETKEGFWGKMNPFARKKYVRRQMEPVVGRVNELDHLTAENSKMITDVDARATEGIRMASLKVTEADNRAIEAGNRASVAQQTAQQANTRLDTIQKTVETLDQYQPVSDTEIRFRPGQAILSSKAKAALDDIALPLKEQKGYVVEVQGFSSGQGRAAIENSQRMADAVVRYLVIEHEIPVFRIFTVGMGNVPPKPAADGSKPRRISGGRVEIALLRNSLGNVQAQNLPASQQPAQPAQQEQPKQEQPK
jgi:outer membrane protein OmpA-like peptidoglycan-associated protein